MPVLQLCCHKGGPCLSQCKKKKKVGGRKEQRKINQNKITFYALNLNKNPHLSGHIREGTQKASLSAGPFILNPRFVTGLRQKLSIPQTRMDYNLFLKINTFKIPNALTAEINKDRESILNTHNDFYYKRKNENAAITDTVNRSHLSVRCAFYIFNLNAYSSRDWSMIIIYLLQSIMEDVEVCPINKHITCLGYHFLKIFSLETYLAILNMWFFLQPALYYCFFFFFFAFNQNLNRIS